MAHYSLSHFLPLPRAYLGLCHTLLPHMHMAATLILNVLVPFIEGTSMPSPHHVGPISPITIALFYILQCI